MACPKVYRDFTQVELDKQYSPSQWAKGRSPAAAIAHHLERLGTTPLELSTSAVVRKYSYAPHPSCSILTVQPKQRAQKKLLVYLHGGYWTAGVLENCGLWLWEGFKDTGVSLAAVEYGLSPPCRMPTIVRHVQQAVAFLHKEFAGYELHLVGHSAGGHLAAMCMMTDWSEFHAKDLRFASVSCVSGVFDLEPIRLSCVDKESQLALTKQDCISYSPLLLVQQVTLPGALHVVVGKHDSPEFQRQSLQFLQAVKSRVAQSEQSRVQYHVLEEDHFSVIEKLDSPGYLLTQVITGMLGGAAA